MPADLVRTQPRQRHGAPIPHVRCHEFTSVLAAVLVVRYLEGCLWDCFLFAMATSRFLLVLLVGGL